MSNKKNIILYILFANVFFWIAFSLMGAILTISGGEHSWFQDGVLFHLMVAFAAWTPTFALWVLFKRLYPGNSIKDFYIEAFRTRIQLKLVLVISVIQLLIFFGSVGITAITNHESFNSLLTVSLPTLGMGFIWTSIQGPTGEQSGWRGFLQPQIEQNFGVIKSSILVGIIWGVWHAPLWFVSGYVGFDLLKFILLYMLAIVSVAVIIGICYKCCRNLFVPIWIHFMFNFTLTMYAGDILHIMPGLTLLYIIVTVGFIIWYIHAVSPSQKQ